MSLFLLLDGNSVAYRAFFALPTDMATASGQVTNAVYGFTSMLINLLKDHRPDRIAVTFDRPEPTFRHEMISDYKAGRAETPDILRQQMGLVRQLVNTLHIPTVELAGFEADDIIATLATQARDRGLDVMVVTGDRDTYQLVEDPHVKVLYNRRGVSDYVLYDEAGIHDRTGVTPVQYPQYAALRGDPSDNLAGVPGVGEKTAAKLINTYGDLDGIFAHLDELTPKLRQNMAEAEPIVRRNAQATPLLRDVPINVDLDDLVIAEWDFEEVRQLFNFLEFRTLWDRLLEVTEGGGKGAADVESSVAAPFEVDVEQVPAAEAAVELINAWSASSAPLAIEAAWEGRAGRSPIEGLAFVELPAEGAGVQTAVSTTVRTPASAAAGPEGAAAEGAGVQTAVSTTVRTPASGSPVPVVWIGGWLLGEDDVRAALSRLLGPGGAPVSAHDAKALMRGLSTIGVDFSHLELDTAIGAYLVDPAGDQYLLEDLSARYGGVDLRAPDAPPEGQLDLGGGGAEPYVEAARRAGAIALLVEPLSAALSARGLSPLYDEIERPLVRVLARMEEAGVGVDEDYLRTLAKRLTEEARALELEIQELAGEPFVVNSTKQLREILFVKLGLAPNKRTKTGFSTDAQSLEKLRGQHPIIEALLHYREVEKLRSTYGDALLAEVAADGRIHATFNQTVARTGRLSSDQPNLHNIPIRSDEGREFRRAFIPAAGCRFLVADYNQIELRVIAHLAEDPGLVEAFRAGIDIHNVTAARVFGVDGADVTLAQRSKAKMVSYGLAYGMESYGLAQRLAIPVDEATQILHAYFEAFPNVKAYMDRVVAEARSRGYTETLFGRRRQIPELQAGNYRIRQAGERQAMNAGIQGLAADIFKAALVRIDRRLDGAGMASRLVLQVHDEVILEVPPAEEQAAAALVAEAMTGAAELNVPLEVHVSWGDTWAGAKS
ncbi:MAG: polymerase [Acidimicrobiaceae bacterium]|nr:polymerase [Acidimicrobiaceae bacterium]